MFTPELENYTVKYCHLLPSGDRAFERQYGLRNKLSPNHAFIDITSKIQTACDKGIFACGVYVDFKKAFDTVNHEFLLNKLNSNGSRRI